MSPQLTSRGWSRRIVAGVTASLVLAAMSVGGTAESAAPPGSRAQVMLETGDVTADPDNAITTGWWGHEGSAGPTGTGTTFLSLNGADANGDVNDGSLAALRTALGTDSLDNIGYAIVPTSGDGTNETPTIPVGANAVEAFSTGRVLDAGFGTPLSGSTAANDSVAIVSTKSELEAWVNAGQPVQSFNNSLQLLDVNSPGSPVSPTPKGKSILNAWPAGTELSLVAYVTDGRDADLNNVVPIVKRGGDGKAQTAWMPFVTVANPNSAIRTSAGYVVVGPYKPTITTSTSFTGSDGTLTATIKNKANGTATDATGNVEFAQVVGGVRGSATPVATANGVASLPVTGLAPGASRTYDLRYVPDTAGDDSYLTTDYKRVTIVNQAATTTSLSVVGGKKATLTAKLGPANVAGSVTFKDGTKTLATVSKSASATSVKTTAGLAAGKHNLSATFTPSSTTYAVSSSAKTVYWASIRTTLRPASVKKGTRPKLTVKVTAPGTTAKGKVKIVVKYAGKPGVAMTKTLSGGAATFTLPTAAKGKASVTVSYLGSGSVLAASRVVTFTVT